MTAGTQTTAEGLRREDDAFRPDIEGLRGVAVLLVVLFHAGLPVAGGFIGVDVFFVISGFLITGLLLREHERTGTISFTRFYARRIRRLLPAGAAVLAVTLVIAFAVVGPLDRAGVMQDGAAAALSVANIRFALAEGDYFTSITLPSPFLHFWSLAVEEQFYLVWPAALLLLVRGGRRRLAVALVLILAGSFAANVLVTHASTSWAFYSLPTRAWQLAAGGLLAVGWGWIDRLPRFGLVLVGWISAVGLAASALLFSSALPYPGVDAFAPTFFGTLLIATGRQSFGPGLLLGLSPIRWVGRISYSLYLWHWPILVLAPIVLGAEIELEGRVGLALAAVIVAALSWRFIEEPFRRARVPGSSPQPALRLGLATLATVVALAGVLTLGSFRAVDVIANVSGPESTLDPFAATLAPPTAGPPPSDAPAGSGAPTPDTTPPREPTPSAQPTPAPITWDQIPDVVAAEALPLPADVRPTLSAARKDNESLWRDGCGAQVPVTEPPDCTYGDESGDLTIALVGDSHAAMWFPALEALAEARGWRLKPYVKLSCPFIDMPVQHISLKREYTECATWRDRVIETLAEQPPDIVIVAMSHRGILPTRTADKDLTSQGEAIGRALQRLPGQVLLMVDTPRVGYDIPGCIAEHPGDVRPCAIPRDPSFTDSFGIRERDAAALAGAATIDLIPKVCPALPCQVVHNGMIVYRDNHHLTATFSTSLAPALEDAIRATVERAEALRPTAPRA
jgi:peptidoglycan/LPS O-acetylase OafA/YrhL